MPENMWLLTYDVERMYPSMDINDTLTTLKNGLPHIFKAKKSFWFHILALILRNNYICAQDTIKRQKVGIATGSAVATAIANLYLHFKYRPVFKRNIKHIITHRRYVDDGIVFTRSETAAEQIATELDEASSLNITNEICDEEAIFLDLRIYKGS